jgi:lipopolysaccharide export system protein LptA
MKDALKYTHCILLFLIGLLTYGQDQVELLHADVIYYNKNLVDAQRLIGNVHFVRDGIHLYCDSAYWFAQKDFTAYGEIKIEKQGGFTLTGDQMYYRNEENKAYVNGNVILYDNDMVLTSPKLDYRLKDKTAHYSGGGKITSKSRKDVLTSQNGIYYSEKDLFHFEKNVRIVHEKYTLTTSKLDYLYTDEIATIIAPTTIQSKNEKVTCSKGFFDAKKETGLLYNRPTIVYEKTNLTGDTIFFDSKKGYGKALQNVVIKDTTKNEIIFGNFAEHFDETGINIVSKKPRIAEVMDADTLWIQADTLWMLEDSVNGNIIKGYHHVVLYNKDFQGRCDSVFFDGKDSVMTLFDSPIFWMDERQITGDTIQLFLEKKSIHSFEAFPNAFVIGALNEGDSVYFDQVKGRKMTGHFTKNELTKLDVLGNGQLLYFPKEKESDTKSIGMNKGECSEITLTIKNRKIKKINLKKKPDSYFIPMQQTADQKLKLDDFQWRIKERPNRNCILK